MDGLVTYSTRNLSLGTRKTNAALKDMMILSIAAAEFARGAFPLNVFNIQLSRNYLVIN